VCAGDTGALDRGELIRRRSSEAQRKPHLVVKPKPSTIVAAATNENDRNDRPKRRDRKMTKVQTAIVQLLAEGSTDKEIAYRVGTSYRTVRTHLERLYERYEVHCRAALVAHVLQEPDRLQESDGGERSPSQRHEGGRD